MNIIKQFLSAAIVATAAMALVNPAEAASTAANVTISNTATVDYKVGGLAQTQLSSNTSTFLVDRKIDVVVAQGAVKSVTPGQLGTGGSAVSFTVTNNSNAPLDFGLVATSDANGGTTPAPSSKTITTQLTNYKVFSDVSGAPGAVITSISAVAAGATVTVWVEADVPAAATNGQVAGTTLTATAVEPTVGGFGTAGTNVAQTAGADNQAAVDTVFADGAGRGDAAKDGKFGAGGEFDVSSAAITVTKTSKVISDGFSASNPKAIPGAIVEYCIQVTNAAAGATATSVVVTDPVPTNTTFVASSIKAGGTVTAGVCNTDGTAVTDAVGLVSGKVTTTIASVAAGVTTTTVFRVTVN